MSSVACLWVLDPIYVSSLCLWFHSLISSTWSLTLSCLITTLFLEYIKNFWTITGINLCNMKSRYILWLASKNFVSVVRTGRVLELFLSLTFLTNGNLPVILLKWRLHYNSIAVKHRHTKNDFSGKAFVFSMSVWRRLSRYQIEVFAALCEKEPLFVSMNVTV